MFLKRSIFLLTWHTADHDDLSALWRPFTTIRSQEDDEEEDRVIVSIFFLIPNDSADDPNWYGLK